MALTSGSCRSARASARGGLRHYGGTFLKPLRGDAAINIIEEITKPIYPHLPSLGNVFAGALMVAVHRRGCCRSTSCPRRARLEALRALHRFIQAFIFALLTIMYFGMAMAT